MNRFFDTASVVIIALMCLPTSASAGKTTALVGVQPNGSILLPNGQTITPAGTQIQVNDRPLGIAVSPDSTTAAVVTGSNFQQNAIQFINIATNTVTQTINGNTFVGVAFSHDGKKLYVGGGTGNDVKIFTVASGGEWSLARSVVIPGAQPSGLSLSPSGDFVYVALNTKTALGIINTSTFTVTQVSTGGFPYTTVTSADGSRVYVSNWGGRLPQTGDPTDGSNPVVVDMNGIASNGTISVFDTNRQQVIANVQVGLHPSAMVLSPDGTRLYVTNSESDSISIVSTTTNTVTGTIDVRPFGSAPLGSMPNAIAVTKDGSTLYVANGGNNSIAVIQPDYRGVTLRGMIPTGWFPAALALTQDGSELLVGNAYGFGSNAPVSVGAIGRSYRNRTGEISVIPLPLSANQLKTFTAQVQLNNNSLGAGESPVAITPSSQTASIIGPGSPIKHVIYVIRENRTYDQVFGDVAAGNGDPSLAIFGAQVTPNAHALVSQFVLLDNFYNGGDQSGLGHQWTDEAWAADYSHKYGNGRNDFNGTNPMAFAPTGFLWDNVQNNGHLTARIYGEFTNINTITPPNATWTQFYNAWLAQSGIPTIVGASSVKSNQRIIASNYPGYALQIPDQVRADIFIKDLQGWVVGKNMPSFVVVQFPDDHTQGTSVGYPKPASMVADNDLALGRLVDAVSHSPFWASTAIFVTEDDSQDGVDHVDGHRGPAFVISPYTHRNGAVDSTLYSNPNMVRTIEQILGLPPMNQYDRAAQTMINAFTATPDFTPYVRVANLVPLDDMNPLPAALNGLKKKMALASARMDFSKPDAAPANLLNHIIWWSVKGYDKPYPGEKTVKIPAFRVIKDKDDQ